VDLLLFNNTFLRFLTIELCFFLVYDNRSQNITFLISYGFGYDRVYKFDILQTPYVSSI